MGKKVPFQATWILKLFLTELTIFLEIFFFKMSFQKCISFKDLVAALTIHRVACTVFLCHFSLALVANVLSQSFSWHFRLVWWDSKWLLKAFMFLKVVLELEIPQDSHCLTFTILSLNTTCHKQTKWPKITHISLPNSKTQKQQILGVYVPILFPKIIKYDDIWKFQQSGQEGAPLTH